MLPLMATVELSTLSDFLDEEEISSVKSRLEETGSAPLDIDETAESVVLHGGIDDDIFVDFQDRLEANEVSADIYLPVDFEDAFEVADYRFGSSHALLLALETLREEFSVEESVEPADDDEEEEEKGEEEDMEFDSLDEEEDDSDPFDDEDSSDELKEDHLRMIWRVMQQGAKTAIKRGLCLVVKS